jgi:hypothetical protein
VKKLAFASEPRRAEDKDARAAHVADRGGAQDADTWLSGWRAREASDRATG